MNLSFFLKKKKKQNKIESLLDQQRREGKGAEKQ